MKAIFSSFRMLLKQLSKDGMLIVMMFVPILAGFFFRFGIPYLEGIITQAMAQTSVLSDYYLLFDLFLATITPYMFCFVVTMTMLDEYDTHIIGHLTITPLTKNGYIISRLGISTIISFLVSLLVVTIFSLTQWTLGKLICVCFLTSVLCIGVAMFIFTKSRNKVEGIAVAKLSGIVMLGLIVPFFLSGNVQFLFGLFPTFWIARLTIETDFLSYVMVIAVSVAWILGVKIGFDRKMAQ